MIDHGAVLLACRARLATLSVASVTDSIAATSTGYTRSSGSFLDDGFRPGMEIVGFGFTASENNDRKTLTSVTALEMKAAGTSAEAAGSRTIVVRLPDGLASENVEFTPTTGEPYIVEEYVPGPLERATFGDGDGELEVRPLYVLRVHVPLKTGALGLWGYVNAILALFRPGTALTVTDHSVTVRGDAGPFAGQLLKLDSTAVITATIPLRVRVANV